jgi:SAM-dependent methyltransferase
VSAAAVIWHDLECGAYTADLPLWRELAAARAGRPILDVGAGTGRVALDLAGRGHRVIALERDETLACELERRAQSLAVAGGPAAWGSVEVICADACDFELAAAPVSLCIVPMQTVQLLHDRPAFLRCARAALDAGGLLALALLGDDVQPFSVELDADSVERDGVRYTSTPTALRQTRDAVVLERRRCARSDATESESLDIATLARIDAATLLAEAMPAGFAHDGVRQVAATVEHVGCDVLLLGAVAR